MHLAIKMFGLWYGKINFFNKRKLLYFKPSKISLNFHPIFTKWNFYPSYRKILLFGKPKMSIFNKNNIYNKQELKGKINFNLGKEIFFLFN